MNDSLRGKLLEAVNSPCDLKKLSFDEMEQLAQEIRRFLIRSISHTGGHLASNLGVVELTMALLYSFNLPFDKVVWDVGHQSYTHKILTGRRHLFSTLRQMGGISGFPKSSESKYDAFDTGHSSTSISAALGIATANKLEDRSFRSIAVIGDGSLTGGLAYEALNNAGRANANLIVVLNDNQMSISANVGALSKHLTDIRTRPTYLQTKKGIIRLLEKLPIVGHLLKESVSTAKEAVKHLLLEGVMFEELGFQYIGPIDGHNIRELTDTFSRVKNMSGPILVHVHTVKGKGYVPAEQLPEQFHGVDCFDIKTGESKTVPCESYSGVFGETLCKLAKNNKKIVAISAAMISGTGLKRFAKRYPDRIFDVGIAEGHAVTFAAGLAKEGYIPFVAIYSSFLQRGFDQIIHDVALQNLHVIFAIDRAGIVGNDGETHQGIFDISFLSMIPNLIIMAPKDKHELPKMLKFAVNCDGPVAIRYPKGKPPSVNSCGDIKLGEMELLSTKGDIAVIGVGEMTHVCVEACRLLREDGVSTTLVNARFIRPLDKKTIEELILSHSMVVTVEDSIAAGGFGSAVLKLSREMGLDSNRVINISLPDKFIEQGTRDELNSIYGLDAQSIRNRIRSGCTNG